MRSAAAPAGSARHRPALTAPRCGAFQGPWGVLAVVVLAVVLAGCTSGPPVSGTPGSGLVRFVEGFEDGLESWAHYADVPDDPETGRAVEWNVSTSHARPRTGAASLVLQIDGRQDDGTVWVTRQVQVHPSAAYHVNVSAYAAMGTGEGIQFSSELLLYVGLEPPSDESSFPLESPSVGDGGSSRAGIREPDRPGDWNRYGFEWDSPVAAEGHLFVAVGMTIVWESRATVYVDDLELKLDPMDATR